MKDAKGHGSDPRGSHSSGVQKVGRPVWTGEGPATFKVQGMHQLDEGGEIPNFIEVGARTGTEEQAQALAAQFPKSAGMKVTGVSGLGPDDKWFTEGLARQSLRLMPTGVTGEKNEAALKRYNSFRMAADKLGHSVVYEPTMGNAYPTEDEFHKAIGWKRK